MRLKLFTAAAAGAFWLQQPHLRHCLVRNMHDLLFLVYKCKATNAEQFDCKQKLIMCIMAPHMVHTHRPITKSIYRIDKGKKLQGIPRQHLGLL